MAVLLGEQMSSFYVLAGGINNGNNYRFMDSSAGGSFIIFDSVNDISPHLSQTVTQYPIEGGATISDNVASRNDTITMTGVVSNCYVEEKVGNKFNYDSIKRVEQAVALLRKLKENKTLLTVCTEYEVWTNCVLTDCNYTQTPQTAESMPFSLTFEKLRFAQTKYVTLDVKAVASTGKGGDASKDAKTNSSAGADGKRKTRQRMLNEASGKSYPEWNTNADGSPISSPAASTPVGTNSVLK
jgi:hypothetical protein